MTPQQMSAVQAEVPAMMAEYGVSNPRAFLEAKAQPARALLPRVAVPGVAAPRGNSASTNLQALNQKLSQTGNIKDATALLMAKRKATRR
jgi:hypothetical protein